MMTSYDIIRKPVITEKNMTTTTDKRYTFIAQVNTNEIQIKKTVEGIFDVRAEKVQTIRIMGKIKRMDVYIGKRADFKKAVITLITGSRNIEFFEGM